MEFKEILKERLEIEYTKRLFKMIPSNNILKLWFYRRVLGNVERNTDIEIWLRTRLRSYHKFNKIVIRTRTFFEIKTCPSQIWMDGFIGYYLPEEY